MRICGGVRDCHSRPRRRRSSLKLWVLDGAMDYIKPSMAQDTIWIVIAGTDPLRTHQTYAAVAIQSQELSCTSLGGAATTLRNRGLNRGRPKQARRNQTLVRILRSESRSRLRHDFRTAHGCSAPKRDTPKLKPLNSDGRAT